MVSIIAFLAIAFIFCVIMFSWIKTPEIILKKKNHNPNYIKDFGILIATAILFVCLLSFKDNLEKCQKEVTSTVKTK